MTNYRFFSVKGVAAYISYYGMIPYMEVHGSRAFLCGCNPVGPAPFSSIQSHECSYSYVKRIFNML